MRKTKYNVGDKFNSWTLINRLPMRGTNTMGLFRCNCGNTKSISISNVTLGKSTMCNSCSYTSREKTYTKHLNLYNYLLQYCKDKELSTMILSIANKVFEEDASVSVSTINPDFDFAEDNFWFTSSGSYNRAHKTTKGIYLQDSGKSSSLWVAKIKLEGESKRRVKAFSINKYGFDKAKELAENQRIAWVNELIERNKQIAKEQRITELVAEYKESLNAKTQQCHNY